MKFKILTTIYFTIFLGLTLVPVSHVSAGNVINVAFENTPLFSEANIVPGDSVTRYIRVGNKVNESIAINSAATGVNDPDGLGDMLNIVIKKGSTILYQNTLSAFFHATNIPLGSLAISENVQYDYTISFNTQAGNNYQEKTLMFDIAVNAQTSDTAGNGSIFLGGSYGGGGMLYPTYNTDTGSSTNGSNNRRLLHIPSANGSSSPTVAGAEAVPDLAISKQVNVEYANPGQNGIMYHLTITNNGNLTAYGIKLQDVLDPGLVYSDVSGNQRSWEIGDLAPGGAQVINYSVDVPETTLPGLYKNTAMVSADNYPTAIASVSLEVKPIKVLGAEFASSGFNIFEFILLIFILLVLLILIVVIRKRAKF